MVTDAAALRPRLARQSSISSTTIPLLKPEILRLYLNILLLEVVDLGPQTTTRK
ncbi:MAG: hypothetical protein QXJ19_00315 [Candidatus Bathyarchaeia archaeon]|nr:hypothetical protein [Candidatus Bathyarchaeota archaeon]